MEQKIRGIWAQILGLDSSLILPSDNFFQVGGDSIASMKVVGAAREVGIHLTVADIFNHTTLCSLAAHCEGSSSDGPKQILPFALLGENVDYSKLVEDLAWQCDLTPESIKDAFPCTRLQEGFMFLSTKRPGQYMEQKVLKLAPGISLDQIKEAVEQMVTAIPILRTRIVHHDDLGLLQLECDDSAQWIEGSMLEEYLTSDRSQSMNLGEPLSRFALVRDDTDDALSLVWTLHHALYDGWSIDLMTDALSRAYSGEKIESGPQFQTFIEYLQKQDNEEAGEYWKQYLDDFDGNNFPQFSSSIDKSVVDSVVRYNISCPKDSKSTVSTRLRAAWALILGQTTSLNDVAFGTTLYGRNAAVERLDDLMAPTIATVPIRINIDSQQTVSQFLDVTQQQATEMMPHEKTGLTKIAALSNSTKKACNFQNFLIIQPEGQQEDGPLGSWQSSREEEWLSTYPLTVQLQLNKNGGIAATATFDSRIIQQWIVEGMLHRLERVLNQLTSDSKQLISDIDFLTAEDLEQIWQCNALLPQRIERRIQDLLADHVAARPESPAICAWDGDLTYRELDELSSRLARHLISTLATGPEHGLIPLCFEKSSWTSVAMLGVLKADAGFTLLDPNLPEQRLQSIVEQLDSKVIISGQSQQNLSRKLAHHVIVLNSDMFTTSAEDSSVELPRVDPSSIAYAVFTSGSSGTPKGVLISHYNAVSSVTHQIEAWNHTPETRLLDFCAYSFDVAVGHFLGVLGGGGCLCIPSEDQRKNSLAETINSLGVNSLVLTPSVTRLLTPEEIPDVRSLAIGAEPLRMSDLQTWRGSVHLRNVYGPSECTPVSVMNQDLKNVQEPNNIGKGVGAVTWIVDPGDHNKLVAPGCTGELLLEGPVVGLGYLNDPVKTDASFIHDPQWLMKGSVTQSERRGRLYKTGDLVKYDQYGDLIFIGRKDSQVKVRGQRVEVEEIEEVLRGLNDVKEASVVVAGDGDDQDSWLAAFITVIPHDDSIDPVPRVKTTLRSKLPSYMVPESIEVLDRFPLTNNGKADRRALSDRAVRSPVTAKGTYRPPTTGAEKQMQSIWSQVLGMDTAKIGMDDGFTQLGGNSLLAMKVVKLARKEGLVLELADMFRHSTTTVEDVCDNVTDAQSGVAEKLLADVAEYDWQIASIQDEDTMHDHTTRNRPLTVALTGVNGFIGTQILRQLLEHDQVGRMVAIGRGSSPSNARDRIVEAATRAEWWNDSSQDRLEVWRGDLASPCLGLNDEDRQSLSDGHIDIMIHNGAAVHFIKSYDTLKAANVDSTVQMLELTTRNPKMRMVYVSSARPQDPAAESEQDAATYLAKQASGYSQSKFVAEALVRRAAAHDSSGRYAVVSPGLVIGTPTEGIANSEDWIWRMAAACIRIGCYNSHESERWIPVSDATTTARTVIQPAFTAARSVVTQVVGGLTIGEFWGILERSGWRVQGADAETIVRRMREDVAAHPEDHPLGALANDMFEAGGVLDREEWAESWRNISKSGSSSRDSLQAAVIKSAETLVRIGFLPPPSDVVSDPLE